MCNTGVIMMSDDLWRRLSFRMALWSDLTKLDMKNRENLCMLLQKYFKIRYYQFATKRRLTSKFDLHKVRGYRALCLVPYQCVPIVSCERYNNYWYIRFHYMNCRAIGMLILSKLEACEF